jgi:predicted dehydrogenase
MAAIRLGLIGAGYWGSVLARVFRGQPGAELLYVCDGDLERRSAFAAEVETLDSVDRLLCKEIDAVLIATPPSTHQALALQVLEAKKHCWVEKPLALNAAGARRLVELAEKQRCVLFVDETFLYDPLVQRAREWIAAGRLGELYHLSFERVGQGRIRRDSSVWWNSAPHDLSILCHLVPREVEDLRMVGFDHLQPGVADYAVATARLAGGVSAHVYLSWLSPRKTASLSVIGSRGMLQYEGRFDRRQLTFFEYRLQDAPASMTNVVPFEYFRAVESVDGDSREPLALAAAAFLESVRGGKPAPSAGIYSQRVVELLARAEVP